MQAIETRSEVNTREGNPRAVCISLCANHDYLTFSGDCHCKSKNEKHTYTIIGTPYGWLHTTAGDIKLWNSASAARAAAKRYVSI